VDPTARDGRTTVDGAPAGTFGVILLVVDDEDVFNVLDTVLRRAGHETIRARDGVEALAALDQRKPDLVLCDRIMPRMSGFELLEVIRAERPELAHLPFVFLTVLGDQRDVAATASLRPTAYLTKPVRARVLLATVNTLLGTSDQPLPTGTLDDIVVTADAA